MRSGHTLTSLSARRAWIEIERKPQAPKSAWSLSARRAWIEIGMDDVIKHPKQRRSPQGERG